MRKHLFPIFIAVLALCAFPANATLLFWSGNGTTFGGAGTWDTTNPHFGTSTSGPFTQVWNNAGTDDATIDNGTGTGGSIVIGTGGITINGTLTLNGALSGVYSFDGSPTMTFSPSSSINVASGISRSFNATYAGTLTKTGAGTMALNNANGNVAKFIVNGGILSAAAPNRYGVGADVPDFFTLNGGTLSFNTTEQFILGKSVTLGAGGGTLTAASTAILATLDKKVTGAGPLSLTGSVLGYILSNSANDWTGGLTLSQTMWLGNANVIPDTATVTLNSGGALNLNSGILVSITKTASGTGYTTAPTVTLTGGGFTTTATATCNLTGSAINRILITAVGAGYTSAPTVGFTGGGGSGATATAAVSPGAAVNETIGTLVLAGGSVTGTGTLTVNTAIDARSSASCTGIIGGPAALTKTTTGTITLANQNNTFSGGVVHSAGTIQIAATSPLGTGKLTLSGTSIKLSSNNTSNRTLGSQADLLTDTLTLGDPANNGQLTLSGPWTIKTSSRNLTVDTITAIFSGGIGQDTSGLGLTKLGSGTLSLTAACTYSGPTTVSAGTLSLNGTGTVGDGTGVLTLSGTTLALTANRAVGSQIMNLFTMTGGAIIQNGNTSTTTVALRHGGGWGASTGTLTLRNTTSTAGGSFDLIESNSFTFSQPIIIGQAGDTMPVQLSTFNLTGTDITYNGVISGYGTFRRSASTAGTGGRTILSGANTYTGNTILNDGEIACGSSSTGPANAPTSGPVGTGTVTVGNSSAKISAFGGARVVGNPFTLNSSPFTISGANDLQLSGNIDLGAATRTLQVDNTGATTLSGILANGGLTKTGGGSLTLAGANTYAGGTTVNAGSLAVLAGSSLGSGNVTVSAATLTLADVANIASGATLNLNTSPTVNLNYAGTINLASLYFNSLQQLAGTWGALGSGATHEDSRFTGTGILNITTGPPPINLTCSTNITAPATSPAGAVVTYSSSATGGCSAPTVTCNPPSGSTFPIGTTTVTCSASDSCGQSATCSFTVTILPVPSTEYFSAQSLLPPPSSVYISPALWHLLFNNGIVIRDIAHRKFTQSLPVPPLGGSQAHAFGSELDFEVSFDGGASFQPGSGLANVGSSRVDLQACKLEYSIVSPK